MSFLDEVGKDWVEEAGGEPDEAPQIVEETPEQAASQPETETPDAEDSQPETPEPNGEGEKFDPVAHRKMMDERRKRQEAEAELIELRRQVQQNQAPPQQKPQAIPDAYEQPEQFGQHFASLMDQQAFNMRAEMSGFRAEQAYGRETVEAATKWAIERNDPLMGQKVRNSGDPVGDVVREYQQSRTLETLAGKSLDDYVRDQAVQKGWIVSPEGAQPSPSPKPSSPTPPRSLASKPGSGGVSQAAQSEGFGDVFSATGMGLKRG